MFDAKFSNKEKSRMRLERGVYIVAVLHVSNVFVMRRTTGSFQSFMLSSSVNLLYSVTSTIFVCVTHRFEEKDLFVDSFN